MLPKAPRHGRIKPKAQKNKLSKYLDFVREQGCLVCKRPASAHHLTTVSPRDDRWVVPLCPEHHQHGKGAIHAIGWKMFEEQHNLDLEQIAQELWENYNE